MKLLDGVLIKISEKSKVLFVFTVQALSVNYNQNLGNFILQRLLVLSNEELFEAVIKQMNALGLLKQAWINNKGGVLARFAERAGNLSEEKQLLVIENLKSAVCIQSENLAESLLLDNG